MKIVVTGAMGHIGSFVIRDFARRFPGCEIVLIDNLMTQRFPSLFDLPTLARYRFVEADVTTAPLAKLVGGASCVLHLAAITDAAGSVDRAQQVEANNFVGTTKVADACAEAGVPLIALSSTSVYGSASEVVDEDCPPEDLNPQSPYASTKLKEEEYVTRLCRQGSLRGVSLRFGTIFGASPGMRFHTAVNKFCWQAAMGQPITVWRTAFDQKRPYLDLVDGSRALAYIIQHDLFDGRIYNVLTLNSTVREIVDTIREFAPTLRVEFVDNRIMNQLSYEVSRRRFEATGFQFVGDLRRGIAETVERLRWANSGASLD